MSRYDRTQVWSDVRVGIISLAGLVLIVLGVTFAGGDKGLIFKKTSSVKAHLADVGGLKKGASVTMNGMTVGKVTEIAFVDGEIAEPTTGEKRKELLKSDRGKTQIEVTMEVRSDVRKRIKIDSLPAVRTQGMLGDRYVDIPAGSEEAEVLVEGEVLLGASATDFDQTLNQALQVLTETEKLLSAVNEQHGTAGKLIYDQQFYNRLMDITDELNELLKDFKKNPRRYLKFSVF